MKKIAYIIVPALTGLFFTACKNEAAGPSQADLDAQVATKVEARNQELKAECDAHLMDAAKLKADSILAKAKGGAKPKPTATPAPTKPTTKPTTTKTTKTTVPVKETKHTIEGGGLRNQSDQTRIKDKHSVEGGGLRSQSDQGKVENKRSVEGGGLRGQSDQSKLNK